MSYSWYLWHWPFIVLAVAAVGRDDTVVRTVAALISLPVAYAAFRLVENPIRFGSLRMGALGRTYGHGRRARDRCRTPGGRALCHSTRSNLPKSPTMDAR